MISVIPYSRTSRTPKHSAAIKYFFPQQITANGICITICSYSLLKSYLTVDWP